MMEDMDLGNQNSHVSNIGHDEANSKHVFHYVFYSKGLIYDFASWWSSSAKLAKSTYVQSNEIKQETQSKAVENNLIIIITLIIHYITFWI